MNKNRLGFATLELILVILIISILAIYANPKPELLDESTIHTSKIFTISKIRKAQMLALTGGENVAIEFDNSERITLEKFNDHTNETAYPKNLITVTPDKISFNGYGELFSSSSSNENIIELILTFVDAAEVEIAIEKTTGAINVEEE
ncbi:MAG: hypothetical protein ACN4E2_01110 [Nitrospinota bacterium]